MVYFFCSPLIDVRIYTAARVHTNLRSCCVRNFVSIFPARRTFLARNIASMEKQSTACTPAFICSLIAYRKLASGFYCRTAKKCDKFALFLVETAQKWSNGRKKMRNILVEDFSKFRCCLSAFARSTSPRLAFWMFTKFNAVRMGECRHMAINTLSMRDNNTLAQIKWFFFASQIFDTR